MVFALTFGGDVAVSITHRVSVVAAARVHQLKDDDREPDGVVARGVSSTVVRYGAGVQVRF